MMTARISNKGQLALPRRIRKILALKPGEHVQFVVEHRTVQLRRVREECAANLAGSLRKYVAAHSEGQASRATVKKEVARAAAKEG